MLLHVGERNAALLDKPMFSLFGLQKVTFLRLIGKSAFCKDVLGSDGRFGSLLLFLLLVLAFPHGLGSRTIGCRGGLGFGGLFRYSVVLALLGLGLGRSRFRRYICCLYLPKALTFSCLLRLFDQLPSVLVSMGLTCFSARRRALRSSLVSSSGTELGPASGSDG